MSDAAELARMEWARRQRGRRPATARPIKQIVAQLLADRRYTAVLARRELDEAWRAAVGDELASRTLPGNVRRGVLHVLVADSATMQEILFCQDAILASLASAWNGPSIRRLRCRLGDVGDR